MVQILKDARYADESAKQWTNIMEGLRPHLQPTLDWMDRTVPSAGEDGREDWHRLLRRAA